MQFPSVTGFNLAQQQVTLPRDFAGELNLVVIAFQRWHQSRVDTWLPFISQIERIHDRVRYYELLVIQRLDPLARAFVDERLRAALPDSLARERTITLYVDKPTFRKSLEFPNEDDIYVLLLDRQGHAVWHTEGMFAPEKVVSLAAVLRGTGRAAA